MLQFKKKIPASVLCQKKSRTLWDMKKISLLTKKTPHPQRSNGSPLKEFFGVQARHGVRVGQVLNLT